MAGDRWATFDCYGTLIDWERGIGDALAEQWAAIGAKVTVTAQTGLPDPCAVGTAHAWVAGWSADYPDPDGVFRGFFQTGWPFYSDDEILEKLVQARSLGNQDERMRLYHEIDRIWVTERAGIVPLAYGRTMLLRRPWVHSVWVNPLQRAHLDKAVVHRDETTSTPSVQFPDQT